MYNGSLGIMSKAGHFPFQILFMQKKKKEKKRKKTQKHTHKKKTSKFDLTLDDIRIEKIIQDTINDNCDHLGQLWGKGNLGQL